MFSCQECGVLNAQRQCSNCSASIVEITETTHPNVTWDEVTNHLISRLKIDSEWMAKHVKEDEFTWWPWFLSQSFRVQTSGKYENSPDNWMRISATTRIARVDESLGLDLVTSATPEFPLGALIYSDGEILINTALLLNPLCRELLLWFHEAALAQATFAHELAMRWAEIDGVEILRSSHPTTGERTDPDELLHIFWGPEYSLPLVPGYEEALNAARQFYTNHFLSAGYELGFQNDDVVFFNAPKMDIGIGIQKESPESQKYGLGLKILVRILEPEVSYTKEATNVINSIVMEEFENMSQFGVILGDPNSGTYGSHLFAYIPHGVLAEARNSIGSLGVLVGNATQHCINVALTVQRIFP